VHEVSVMTALLDSVEAHAARIGAKKILAINLVIGERASIIDDSLLFAFDLLTPARSPRGPRSTSAARRCASAARRATKTTTGLVPTSAAPAAARSGGSPTRGASC